MFTWQRVVVYAAMVAAIAGCGGRPGAVTSTSVKPVPVAAPSSSTGTEHAEVPKDAPTITVTSEQFYKEFKADKEATKKKYQGAAVLMSGTLVMVSADITGRGLIGLEAEAKKAYPWVDCILASDPEPWARYSPGQAIKIRGMYKGDDAFSDPVLVRCAVLEAGPNPASTTTAAKLADELADPKAAKEKYKGKYFYVSGEVEAVSPEAKGGAMVFLKGNGKTRVPLGFAPADGKEYEKYKIGSNVKVFAMFDGYNFKVPCLRDCKLITK